MDDGKATVFYAPEPLWDRFWRLVGFHHAHADRRDEDEEKEGFAPSWFIVTTNVWLGWADRFRVVLSGKLQIEQAIKTDKPIGKSESTSAVGILPPSTKIGKTNG